MLMKKKISFLIPVLFIFFFSCSSDDEPVVEPIAYEKVPIISTNLPQELTAGQMYKLRITYERPTRCHKLAQVQIEELKGEYFFSIVTSYNEDQACEPEDLTAATTVDFVPEPEEIYIFNFWQGKNEQGEDVYLTVEVPVKSNST